MTMNKSTKQQLLLLALVAGSASAKNNILSQIGSIVKDNSNLANAPTVDTADYDAATGTVRDKEPKDNSCDGQLTRDLIRTTELASNTQKFLDEESAKHKAALETIVELQQTLAKTQSDFINEKEAKLELKASMDESISKAINDSKDELEAMTIKAEEDLKALRDEKDSMIASLQEESSSVIESLKATAQKEYQQLKEDKDEMIASLEAKLKMSTDELQETMRLELEKAKKDKEDSVLKLTAEKEATVEKMTLAMEKASKEASVLLEKVTKESEASVASLKAERDEQVGSLQALMEKEVSERNAMIESLEGVKEKMKEIIVTHEEALEEAHSEISHWRTLHASRTYCNMTHVAEDFYDLSASVYKQASDKAMEVYDQSMEYSTRAIQDKYDEHWPTIAPYYEDIVSGNYERIEPHLETHVYPQLRLASAYTNEVIKPKVLEVIDDGKKAVAPVIEEKYDGAAKFYAEYCSSSLTEFVKATQEVEVFKDHPPPAFLLESWETSCKNPHDSMKALMQGVGTLFAIIFYRRILGLAWSIALFVLLIPVKLTPLRFFLPRKAVITKEIESPPSSPSPMMQQASSDSLMKAIVDDEDEGEVVEGEADVTLY